MIMKKNKFLKKEQTLVSSFKKNNLQQHRVFADDNKLPLA